MKQKIKNIVNLIILLVIAIVAFIFVKSIPSFLLEKDTISKLENQEILDMAPGAAFEVNPSNTTEISYADGHYWKVTVPGIEQIYCAEKGAHLSRLGDTYEAIVQHVSEYTGKTGDHECVKPESKVSRPYYKATSSREATDVEAFVLTWPDPDWNSWSGLKQEAIWDTEGLSNNLKPPSSTIVGLIADDVSNYAIFYGQFAGEIKGNGGKIFKSDNTDQNTLKVSAGQSANEYVVGPFSLDYANGVYGLTFGGISDMYLVGEHSSRIDIKGFIIEGIDITPPYYFEPLDDKHLVGVGLQNYPRTGQQFYVKYTATSDEQIDRLHVEFEWMEAKANITYYDAFKYKSVFECKHTDHCDGHDGTGYDPTTGQSYSKTDYCDGCCFKCEITSAKVSEFMAGYQKLLSATGSRQMNKQAIDIPIPKHKEPSGENSPNAGGPPEKNLEIKLAGNVWEDEKSGKESLVNGVKDSTEKMKAGVEVILHYSDGSIVSRTVTDNNGYYEFNNLNAQRKYYIEFVYDGQIYQATQYNTGLSSEQRMQGGITNATEIASEREGYNNHFAEIKSAPANYTVRRSLYYNVGTTNKAYIISKPSTETPYGIKEIYDYVIQRAVATKSYSQAYQDALNTYGNNDLTKSKLQFVEDCRISSYTGYDTSRVTYPIWDKFTESYTSRTIGGIYYPALYPTHLQIDFGLTLRETFDLALRKDVQKTTVEINGKAHTYTYDTRNNADETDDGTWDISVRLSDAYYNTKYSREVFGSDYQYKVSDYDNSAAYGKDKADEINVYVTYKLTVRNQSQSVLGEVMEIVDYYDEDYEYIDERSYIEIKYGNNKGQYPTQAYANSRYGTSNETTIAGYDNLYVRGLEGKKLSSGQTAYVYLTFRIKKDNINGEDWIRLDEQVESATAIGVGKENIAEVNGFKTYYANGTVIPNVGTVNGTNKVAGLFDKDSVPGNINSADVPKDGNINYQNFEDDTDKAPNIRLILYRENGQLVCRTVDGIVWEDERTDENKEQVTTVGDGLKQNETSINGVTVQLVELMDNGTEYIWKQFSSGQNYINANDVYTPVINVTGESGNTLIPADTDNTQGKYIFKSYPTGNYIIRFVYGDTVKTVLPSSSTQVTNAFGQTGQNTKSYNGQDYKSTTYQEGITPYTDYANSHTSGSYIYNITASDANPNVSDAKDIMKDNNVNNPYYRQNLALNSREDVIGYSELNVKNYIAEVLASHDKVPANAAELTGKLNELITKTQMTAETGIIDIEVEYDRNATGNQVENNGTTYKIQNLNLGLEERPKSQLSINKEVTNVKLTLADGSTLFDATQKATNVLWRKHKQYEFKYKNNKLTADPMAEIREKNSYDVVYGLIQLTMDEELMHGATIKISYKVTVTNVGEVDYKDNQFYYTGVVSNKDTIVKTISNQVIDYVANNLQFYAVDNEAWQVISQEELLNGLVNMTLANETAKYNTVITTSEKSNIAKTWLIPEIYGSGTSSVSDDLILTQLITSENDTDDLTYRNIVEIVRTSNDVGRRNAYSIAGNQNPTADVTEVDTDVAEIVKILPPYGNGGIYYIIAAITILASALLITGIIFIKKKVLK